MDEMPQAMLHDRELPYSLEAEQAVLGSAIADSVSVAESAEIVKPSDFYFAQNREIYSAILDLFNENRPIDYVTLADALKQSDKLEVIGGLEYLVTVANMVPTTGHVEYYSNIIREKAQLRRLIQAGQAIMEIGYRATGETDRILDQAEQLVFDVASENEKRDIVPVKDIVMETYQQLVESSLNDGFINGVDTGYDELNRRTGGFHGGELILIAGRPGMGKSSFAVNIAEHVAIQNKQGVAIFNLEMPKVQVVSRILCSQALVDSYKIRTGELDTDEWQKIGEAMNRIYSAPIFVDDTPTITVSEIRAKCRRLKQTHNLSMVVIDYLQLMQSGKKTDSRQQEVTDISRSLKILAKELDLPVIALSQLSRASEGRSDKRPVLSDLRESGAIEQDAEMVMFLYRDEYYNKDSPDKGLAECIMAKHRSGETGTFKLGWKGKYTKFINLEYIAEDTGKT